MNRSSLPVTLPGSLPSHSSPSIARLSSSTSQQLRANSTILSISSAIHELVANSLDAEAQHVQLIIDMRNMNVTIADDGKGMTRQDLTLFGRPHTTSKVSSHCSTAMDLSHLNDTSSTNYGWRGEAISSLALLAKLRVDSRPARHNSEANTSFNRPTKICRMLGTKSLTTHDNATYTKYIEYGEEKLLGFSNTHRSFPGSIISFQDLYHSMPVRHRCLQREEERLIEYQRVKQTFMRLALIQPNVEFSLYQINAFDRGESSSRQPSPSNCSFTQSCPHLVPNPWQRVWHKPKVDSLLENFECITGIQLIDPSAMSPSMCGAGSIFASDSFYQLYRLQFGSAFQAAKQYMESMYVSGFMVNPSQVFLYDREHQLVFVNRHAVHYSPLRQALDVMLERIMDMFPYDMSACSFDEPFCSSTIPSTFSALSTGDDHCRSKCVGASPPSKQSGRRRYSPYLLHIEMPGDHYDLLFEPDKTKIEFKCRWSITDGLVQGLERWLIQQIQSTRYARYAGFESRYALPASPDISRASKSKRQVPVPPMSLESFAPRSTIATNRWRSSSSLNVPVNATSPMTQKSLSSTAIPAGSKDISSAGLLQLDRHLLESARLIGQLDSKFILARTDSLIIAIDQHAADERRRLEYIQQHLQRFIVTVRLSRSVVIELLPNEISLVKMHLDELKRWGIQCQPVTQNRLLVHAIPSVCGEQLTIDDVRDCIASLNRSNMSESRSSVLPSSIVSSVSMPPPFHRILNSKSCRSSVMFGDFLQRSTMSTILTGVMRCQFPFNCAHGRPTMTPLAKIQSTSDESRSAGHGWERNEFNALTMLLTQAKRV